VCQEKSGNPVADFKFCALLKAGYNYSVENCDLPTLQTVVFVLLFLLKLLITIL
jgi:hypothetical protein